MGFSRQEYWSGLPFPSPGDLPDPAIEPKSPALQTDSTDRATREALVTHDWHGNSGQLQPSFPEPDSAPDPRIYPLPDGPSQPPFLIQITMNGTVGSFLNANWLFS